MTVTAVDVLLEAKQILNNADILGRGADAMECAIVEAAPCVEAAVVGAYERITGVERRIIDEQDYFDYLSGNYEGCDIPSELLQCNEALLETASLPRVSVWIISDDLCDAHGPIKAKLIAMDWLDDAAIWMKEKE